jgi:hypothetical protein
MANWSLPTVNSVYTDFVTEGKDRDLDVAKGMDPAAVTVTNPVANMVRWNSANRYWEIYSGASWGALASYYAIEVGAFTGDVTKSAGSSTLALAASVVLAKLLTVDGAGSGLDADLLDGLNSTAFPLTNGTGASGTWSISISGNAATVTGFSGTHSGTSTGTNTGDEPSASESTEGVIEIATQAETNAGTDDGRALTPLKLKNVVRPAFSAYRAAALTLTNTVFTSIVADTEDFDTNSNYNTSNGRFTPTVAGKYLVWGHGGPDGNSAGSAVQLAIYKNGAASKISYDRAPGSTGIGHGVTAFVDMNGSTDYLEFLIMQDSGGDQALTTGIYNSFAGHWVCA